MGKSSRPLGQQRPPPGVYRDEPDRDDAASQSSAISLHEDILAESSGEVPPPYSDGPNTQEAVSTHAHGQLRALDLDSVGNEGEIITKSDNKGSTTTWLTNELTSDPVRLQDFAISQTLNRPRAFIWLHGEHTESQGDGNKTKKVKKADFDIKLDVTDTISRRKLDEEGRVVVPEWSSLWTVDQNIKTYRGTILQGRGKKRGGDPENGNNKPTLEEWCHLFCASNSKLKSFTIRHNIIDRNETVLENQTKSIIRSTNYRGHITVRFQLSPRTITVQTPHLFNKLRHNKIMYWFCIIFQLWIITWPILFFMSKRWAVVHVSWPYKRCEPVPGQPGRSRWTPVKETEEQWAKRFTHTIQQGVLSRAVNGTVIDYIAQDERWHEEDRQRRERERQARESEPQGGLVGGALSLMRGVSNIVRENESARGWGYDS